jgi:hypothetical protein
MRGSTWLFLGLGAAFAFFPIRIHSAHSVHRCAPAPSESRAVSRAKSTEVSGLEREHARLSARGRELEVAVQALDQPLRTLRSLAKQSRSEAIAAECAAVEAGRVRLLELQQENAAQTATAAARVQLARVGVDDLVRERASAVREVEASPSGPLEALERLDDPATGRAAESRGSNRAARLTSRER